MTTTQLALEDEGITLMAFDDCGEQHDVYVQSPDLNLYLPLDSIPEHDQIRLQECKVQLQETGREVFNILSKRGITELPRGYGG